MLPKQSLASVQVPRISIRFCTQCHWMLRAAYVGSKFVVLHFFQPFSLFFLLNVSITNRSLFFHRFSFRQSTTVSGLLCKKRGVCFPEWIRDICLLEHKIHFDSIDSISASFCFRDEFPAKTQVTVPNNPLDTIPLNFAFFVSSYSMLKNYFPHSPPPSARWR